VVIIGAAGPPTLPHDDATYFGVRSTHFLSSRARPAFCAAVRRSTAADRRIAPQL
jgi:hypothetical protein